MPPKRDDRRLLRGGRSRTHEEEPTETIAPMSEKEMALKEEYVILVFEYYSKISCTFYTDTMRHYLNGT